MKTDVHSTPRRRPIRPTDLFVILEQAFRRHHGCRACTFSLPERLSRDGGDWIVIPSPSCSDNCSEILEQLVARFRADYRLNDA
jgi:hypothetical protein